MLKYFEEKTKAEADEMYDRLFRNWRDLIVENSQLHGELERSRETTHILLYGTGLEKSNIWPNLTH